MVGELPYRIGDGTLNLYPDARKPSSDGIAGNVRGYLGSGNHF